MDCMTLAEENIRRSAMITNNCLPHEVLATIFIQCAHDHYSAHPGCPVQTAPTWVNISYVCRYWRDIALNCPSLWTYIFMVSRRWTEELLARSKQASLKIRVRLLYVYGALRWLHSLDKVLEHLKRIQQLHLALPTPYAQHVLSKLRSRAPRLENLEILLDTGSPQTFILQSSSVLFDGDTPSLRSLKLSECGMPWCLFKLDALTTLHLHCVAPLRPQSVNGFLGTLSRMRDLRELYLDRSLTSASGVPSNASLNTFQKVNLLHLSRLLIAAPLSTVIALLSCVNTPATTQIRIRCYSERQSSPNDYALLSSLLSQRLVIPGYQGMPGPVIRSFCVDSARSSTTVVFSASKRDCDFSLSISGGEWDRNLPLKVNIAWPRSQTENDRQRIINGVCCAMPLTNVQTVHLIDPPSWPAFWTQVLGTLQDLRYIKLSAGNMPVHLVSELSVIDREGTENSAGRYEGPVFAPYLEELKLYGITFSPVESDASELGTTRDSLISALATRRDPHGRLTMTICNAGTPDRFDLVASWGGGEVRIISENASEDFTSEEGSDSD